MENNNEETKEISLLESLRILFGASKAFWLVNLVNFGDGIAYFGILTLLTRYLGTRVGMPDDTTSLSVSLFTGFVTLFMFGGGMVSDKLGVRKAITFSLFFLLLGRVSTTVASQSPYPFATAWIGLLLMAFGSGVIQPALYAGTKEYTDSRTATIAYSFLYAIMNLGICLGEFCSPMIRTDETYNIAWLFNVKGLNWGYEGVFWVCSAITAGMLLTHLVLFTRHVEETQRVGIRETQGEGGEKPAEVATGDSKKPWLTMEFIVQLIILSVVFWAIALYFDLNKVKGALLNLCLLAAGYVIKTLDVRFSFFIFILLPVRTLFAHQFLTLPDYVFRVFPPEVSARFEWINIINPLIIVIFVPLIAALTRKVKIIDMMIIGTTLSAVTTFILVPKPNVAFLLIYIILFSLGEAIWSSRFLEYVANLAPAGQVGAYMGLAGIPWFLAKTTTGFYSGAMLEKFIPAPFDLNAFYSWFGLADILTPWTAGTSLEYYFNWFFIEVSPKDPSTLWMIYGIIACISPIGLVLGKSWMERKAAAAKEEGK